MIIGIILGVLGIAVTVALTLIGFAIGKRSNRKLLEALKKELDILRQESKSGEIHYIDTEGLLENPSIRKARLWLEGLRARREHRYSEALEKFEGCLPLASNEKERCFLLNLIGTTRMDNGDNREALESFLRMVSIAEKAGFNDMLAKGLVNVGRVNDILGRPQEALSSYRRAFKIADQLEGLELKAFIFGHMGLVYRYTTLGESRKALRLHRCALRTYEKIGDLEGQAAQLGNIGLSLYYLGNVEEAQGFFKKALRLAEKIGDLETQANQQLNMGLVHYSREEFEAALEDFDRALTMFREFKDLRGQAKTIGAIGVVYAASGRNEEALGYFQDALNISEKIDSQEIQAANLSNMGLAHLKLNRSKEAFLSFRKALDLTKRLGSKELVSQAERGMLLARTQLLEEAKQLIIRGNTSNFIAHNPQQALSQYRCAFEIGEFIGDLEIQAMALCNIAGIYAPQGEYQKALKFLEKGRDLFKKAGLADWLEVCDFNIAEVTKAMEEDEQKGKE